MITRIRVGLLATGLLCLPAVASATSIDVQPATATTTASADANRVVCRELPKTGTRFNKRECKTAAEWDRARELARRDADEMMNKPRINSTSEH